MRRAGVEAVISFSFGVLAVVAACGCSGNRPLREPAPDRGASPGAAVPAAPGADPGPMSPSAPSPGGAAGTSDVAGSGGAAGTFGAPAPTEGGAGMPAPPPPLGGAAGAPPSFPPPPPPPAFCDSMPHKALPYPIASDFSFPFVINAIEAWSVETGIDCNQTAFPDVAGADAGAGDGGVSDAGWSVTSSDAGPPPAGDCLVYRYDPDDCWASIPPAIDGGLATDPIMTCWAGVILTPSPAANAGPGICIAPGATAIHFKARASRDPARVKFGSIRAGLGETEFFIDLTTAWADYTVSIPAGEDYDDETPGEGVWNGFSIVAEPEDHAGGTYIFVSDVVWATQ
jgi:hypothetical protein